MPSFLEARNQILANVPLLGQERVLITDAVGRILAEDITASWDMPRWTNSAMDGYAVRSQDCMQPARLEIVDFIAAGGASDKAVVPGVAIKIMTGAPLPEGSDAVVPVEEATADGTFVQILKAVKPGAHIRNRGEDVLKGECIVPRGTLLRPAEIGMLASYGKAFLPVYRKPRVAILSTGDELVELGEPLPENRIINSNSLALVAALKEIGAEPVILGIALDNRASHIEKISEGLKADVLITSAGVSTGDRDFVRAVLEDLGAKPVFWKVDIKPGRPTTFAMKDGKPIFSLPGNPVSTMVTFEELVKPGLLKMMGHTRVIKQEVEAVLETDLTKKRLGVLNFQRVNITIRDGQYFASCSGDQNTGILKTMVRADALALLPEDKDVFMAGERVKVHILGPHVTMQEG
ncbi:MAG: gephyrin-like molybdotransferase Glp [Pedobacter sp.]